MLPLSLNYHAWRKGILINLSLLICFMVRILFYLLLISKRLNPGGKLNLVSFSVMIPFLSFISDFPVSSSFLLVVWIFYFQRFLSSPEAHLFTQHIISVLFIVFSCSLKTSSANCWYFVPFTPTYCKLIYHSRICAKSFELSPVSNASDDRSSPAFIFLVVRSGFSALHFQINVPI